MRTLLLTALLVVATSGVLLATFNPTLAGDDPGWSLAWLLWTPVGCFILLKRPANRIGHTLMLIGCAWGTYWLFDLLAVRLRPGKAPVWAELIGQLVSLPAWIAAVWLLLIFPTGRLAGRPERMLAYGLAGLGLAVAFAFATSGVPMYRTGLPSPLAIPVLAPFWSVVLLDESFLIPVALVFGAIATLVRRWRRSSGNERRQYQRLLLGAFVYAVILAASQILPEEWLSIWLFVVGGSTIPSAIGVAVLRYRLYEIDRIISRTTAYAVLIGMLALTFAAVVAVTQRLLPAQNQLSVVGSTLLVAALFTPLRRRVQLAVDRRFNRSRYDVRRVLDEFSARSQDDVDMDRLQTLLLSVTQETVQPTHVSLWLAPQGTGRPS